MRRAARTGIGLAVASAALVCSAQAVAASRLVGAVSNSDSLSGATAVAVSGSYAYTTGYWHGQLTAVNVSNPANPTVAGSTPSEPYLEDASNVTIAGNEAFVVSKNRNLNSTTNDDGTGNSLTIVDISNPGSPAIVGHLQDAAKLFGAYGVAVSSHYAFVASQGTLAGQAPGPRTSTGSFSVVDVSNPASPAMVGHIDNVAGQNFLEHVTSVAISGHFAYVTAFYDRRVTVIDISSPARPTIVTSFRDAVNLPLPQDVAVQGNYAYVANQSIASGHQFTVLGISNPSHPVVVGSLTDNSLSGAYRIRVRGNFAYIAASSASTIAAINISDPAHPRIAASLQDSAHLNTTIGLDLDPSGQHVIASSPRLASQGTRNVPPFPTATGTVSVIDLQAAPQSASAPTISGPALQGARLLATPGGWSGYPAPVFTYAWQRCNVNGALCHAIAGATSATYATHAADVGARLRVLVGAANAGGVSSATSAATAVVKPDATAALTGLARGRPNLRIKVVAPSSQAPVKRIVITLPGGLSFARSGSTLTKGIVVKDGRGRKLRFTAGTVRGSLVIVLRASAASVQLTVGSGSISISSGLARKVKHKRTRKLRVGVAFFDARHGTHRASVLAPAA